MREVFTKLRYYPYGRNRWNGQEACNLGSSTLNSQVHLRARGITLTLVVSLMREYKNRDWNVKQQSLLLYFLLQEGVTCVTWIGTSKYLATGCADGTVSVWDSLLGNCVHTYHGHQDAVQAISVSTNTDFIVSVSVDNTARVYDTSEFQNKME